MPPAMIDDVVGGWAAISDVHLSRAAAPGGPQRNAGPRRSHGRPPAAPIQTRTPNITAYYVDVELRVYEWGVSAQKWGIRGLSCGFLLVCCCQRVQSIWRLQHGIFGSIESLDFSLVNVSFLMMVR